MFGLPQRKVDQLNASLMATQELTFITRPFELSSFELGAKTQLLSCFTHDIPPDPYIRLFQASTKPGQDPFFAVEIISSGVRLGHFLAAGPSDFSVRSCQGPNHEIIFNTGSFLTISAELPPKKYREMGQSRLF
ncbi:MAG: hypothetical protein GY785_08985 [Gammaproteobacteria bacterium]|nr:hypothetical protein [Gammaproteobacteria bacterium]